MVILGTSTSGATALVGLRNFSNLLPVATNPDWPAATAFTDAGRFTRKKHTVGPAGARSLALMFSNMGAGDAFGANAIKVKCSIELTAGTYIPMQLHNPDSNGYSTIQPGEFPVTDPFFTSLAPGTVFWSNTNVQPVSPGTTYPQGKSIYVASGTEKWVANTTTDYTATAAPAIGGDGVGYAPVAVIGEPLSRTYNPSRNFAIIWGDSLCAGTADGYPADGTADGGYAARALRLAGVPYMTMSSGGGTGAQFGTDISRRMKFLAGAGATHLICNTPGVNDLNAGSTLAQMQSRALAIAQAGADQGMKVYGVTVSPRTTSSDSFATLANQAAATATFGPEGGSGSILTQYNTWLKTVPTPFTGVFDAMAVLGVYQGSSDTYVWRLTYNSGDGIHPSATGYAAAATAFSPTMAGWLNESRTS